MKRLINLFEKNKKLIIDFIYSFISYMLPTLVLQFMIQPIIASRLSPDSNGLFITLFSIIKMMIGVLIAPLANLRLLKKQECKENDGLNCFMNFLFVIAVGVSLLIGSGLHVAYSHLSFDIISLLRFVVILLLIAFHDYYSIEFRLTLDYKKIVVDNVCIIFGYFLGILLFLKTMQWEYIFILGYLCGCAFVLIATKLWRGGILNCENKKVIQEYSALGSSSLLNNATVYCDKMLIYPILGGNSVSVYNAAAIVSKAISVVSTPLRNVLLSYIVNYDKPSIKKNVIRRFTPIFFVLLLVAFCGFWGISIFLCNLLYPQYANMAMPYIPIIIMAIISETMAGILNIVLLRYAKPILQTVISGTKLVIYLVCVIIFSVLMNLNLLGFSIAILLAALSQLILVIFQLRKTIKIIE